VLLFLSDFVPLSFSAFASFALRFVLLRFAPSVLSFFLPPFRVAAFF
jgi:hypothetical protein